MSHFLDRLTYFTRDAGAVLRRPRRRHPRGPHLGGRLPRPLGSTTRSCARRTASTAPARAAGRSTSRAAWSPGRRSRPTTRARARTCPTTSRAAARAARRTPGTCTAPTGVKYPMVRGRAGAAVARGAQDAGPGRGLGVDRRGPGQGQVATSRCAAWAASCARRWDEVNEIIAAANVYTIKKHGPDRVVGFSPIPAMSMVSYAAGSRYLSLIGGVCMSFYDWYCDLPPSSPQTWGEQTDVPESADWYNSTFIMAWGSQRAADAHARRALLHRGPLQGRQDRRGDARLRRGRQARRPVAAPEAGHRRRAGDGDGPRDPEGVPPRAAVGVLPGLLPPLHRHADAGEARRAAAASWSPTAMLRASDLAGGLGQANNPEWKTVAVDEASGNARLAAGLDRLSLGPEGGRRPRQVEPRGEGGRRRRRQAPR